MYASTDPQTRTRYLKLLSNVGSVSRLFSTSEKPYLDYRIAENLFCMTFGAENLSRSCIAIDAKMGTLGIGIKTFVDTPLQKIAEFDKKMGELNGDPLHDAVAVSNLRNLRLNAARDSYGVDRFIYHCIVRTEGAIRIFEEPMEHIDVDRIRVTKATPGSIQFTDGRSRYTFNRSKSTLLKIFKMDDPIAEVSVEFLENPIATLFGESGILQRENLSIETGEVLRSVILPLYSTRGGRHVPEKSGLNQWNAAGRKRDSDEVYVPLPKNIRNENPDFFPPRYEPFRLFLPDGTELSASVCQDDGKAIMSNPNKALGHWLLRTVLHLEEGELATIEKLDELGIDAVIITKYPDHYRMDFTYIGDDSGDGEEE